MSESTTDILKRIAPEFVDTDQSVIDPWIAQAQRGVNASAVGDEYNTLVAYKAAYLMTKAKPGSQVAGGTGRVLLSSQVDNAKYTYANSDEAKAKRAAEFLEEFESRLAEFIYIEEGPV